MPSSPLLRMTLAGATDAGRVRARNEDNLALGAAQGFAIVCDGMGGHAGGDVASRIAATSVAGFLGAQDGVDGLSDDAAAVIITGAVDAANRRIVATNARRGSVAQAAMGTTIVGFWRLRGSDRYAVFHVGDSRLYRLRGGVLEALTRDHSLHQYWLDNGERGPEPGRNTILKALGFEEGAEPDLRFETALDGDVLLLCSDGLNGMLDDEAIASALNQKASVLDETCARLIALANEAGGADNITVALVQFSQPGPA